ncbi:MAG: 3,4-dihydroxy-2-butanone-4-phosphate synthase [Hadesarchaea archaeon]|nr:3,4-dihydroxy-2-butanone-4-phosphate synthase [Hadesarchaea archaeon]
MSIERALRDLREGKFVLLHDDDRRENEVDMVIAARGVRPPHIATMRRDAGGLICVALHPKVADNLGLPYLTDIYKSVPGFKVLEATEPNDLPYDEISSFSISVNHRKTFTGITDSDRALTISELGRISALALDSRVIEEFGRNFRSPGHVPLLRAANGLLRERLGHTELAVALAEMAGLPPAVAICEMLDGETHLALSKEKARRYALERGLAFLNGEEVIRAYEEFHQRGGCK